MFKKCLSVTLATLMLLLTLVFPTITAGAEGKQPVENYDGQISKAFQLYRDDFIDELMKSKSIWQPSSEFATYICFADLDFDGKNEFLVYNAGGSAHIVYTKVYSWNGEQLQEIKDISDPNYGVSTRSYTGEKTEYGYYLNPSSLNYYYNNDTHEYMITGTMGLRGGWAYGWSGLFTVDLFHKKLSIDYIRSSSYEVETISSGVYETHYTYYDGAEYYANTETSKVISEDEFEGLKETLLNNCDDLDVKIETLSYKTWNNYGYQKQRDTLKSLYNSFNYNKTYKNGRDGWSIANAFESFGYEDNYHISYGRYNDVYGVSISSLIFAAPLLFRWNGNCYGLSLMSLAQYYGIVDLKQYFSGSGNSLYNFGRDKTDTTSSGEEYYSIAGNTPAIHMMENALVSQCAKEMQECEVFAGDSDYSGLIDFLSSEHARPLLVTLPTNDAGSGMHTMVISANAAPLKTGDNRYVIPLYDCNYPSLNPELHNTISSYSDKSSYLIVTPSTSEWEYHAKGNTGYRSSYKYNSLATHGRSIRFYDVSGLEPAVFTRKLSLISKYLQLHISVGLGDMTIENDKGEPLLVYEDKVFKYIADNCILEPISDSSGDKQTLDFIFETDARDITVEADDAEVFAFSDNYIFSSQLDGSYVLGLDAEKGIASASCTRDDGKLSFAVQSLKSDRCIAVTENTGTDAFLSVAIDGDESGDKAVITSENIIVNYESEGVDSSEVILEEKKTFLLGDVDGDGDVTIVDISFLQRKQVNIPIPIVFDDKVADLDGDGYVSVIDVTYLQRWIVNLEFDDNIGKPIKI